MRVRGQGGVRCGGGERRGREAGPEEEGCRQKEAQGGGPMTALEESAQPAGCSLLPGLKLEAPPRRGGSIFLAADCCVFQISRFMETLPNQKERERNKRGAFYPISLSSVL